MEGAQHGQKDEQVSNDETSFETVRSARSPARQYNQINCRVDEHLRESNTPPMKNATLSTLAAAAFARAAGVGPVVRTLIHCALCAAERNEPRQIKEQTKQRNTQASSIHMSLR
jgi:hypothetical protein